MRPEGTAMNDFEKISENRPFSGKKVCKMVKREALRDKMAHFGR
jgi:hypothetical protein